MGAADRHPVGAVCLLCEELIDVDDTGTVNYVGQVTHYECMMRSVLGSVGHLRGSLFLLRW
jgi:hypothetical protein